MSNRRRFVVPAAVFVAALSFTAALSAALLTQDMPEGPGKDETTKICGKCHEAVRAASIRLTPDGWTNLVADMVNRGASGSPEELAVVTNYLVTNFPGEADRPINLNTASNIDMESVLGLLRREAAALIEYRDKAGPFKSLDDLKAFKGVDFKKLEERKDRIVF